MSNIYQTWESRSHNHCRANRYHVSFKANTLTFSFEEISLNIKYLFFLKDQRDKNTLLLYYYVAAYCIAKTINHCHNVLIMLRLLFEVFTICVVCNSYCVHWMPNEQQFYTHLNHSTRKMDAKFDVVAVPNHVFENPCIFSRLHAFFSPHSTLFLFSFRRCINVGHPWIKLFVVFFFVLYQHQRISLQYILVAHRSFHIPAICVTKNKKLGFIAFELNKIYSN